MYFVFNSPDSGNMEFSIDDFHTKYTTKQQDCFKIDALNAPADSFTLGGVFLRRLGSIPSPYIVSMTMLIP